MPEFSNTYLATKEINLGGLIPGATMIIREPTRGQVYKIKKAGSDEEKIIDEVIKIAPSLVVSHNIEEGGAPMDTGKLLNGLFESLKFTRLFAESVTGFFTSAPTSTEGSE